MMKGPVTFRPGSPADSHSTFRVWLQSIMDFTRRVGVTAFVGAEDPEVAAQIWERRRPLWEHLGRTAEHFWIAETEGEAIGYARSILRNGVRELTEFFVVPGEQSAGVGRELLSRAFPAEGARHRVIVATVDPRALARYLKAGLYPYVPVGHFTRAPEEVSVHTDLRMELMEATPEALGAVGTIDQEVLGYLREIDHRWLAEQRPGYLFRRDGAVVGYGYVSEDWYGPFAVLRDDDFPAVLAHAETQARSVGAKSVGFFVPLINGVATDYLLRRRYQLDGILLLIMSDAPFGSFERYLLTTPPFFL